MKINFTAGDGLGVPLAVSQFSPVQGGLHVGRAANEVVHRVRAPLLTALVLIELPFF